MKGNPSMSSIPKNERRPQHDVDSSFWDRWSPRAFRPDQSLSDCQVTMLFEAARWAPSCMNEQPWEFHYARTAEARELFLSALVEQNRVWARNASMVIFVATRRNFRKTGKVNRHSGFDAGAAWMSLALQARRLGLFAHAMAGFSMDKAYEILRLNAEEYDILAAMVVGEYGDPDDLPAEIRSREAPNSRNNHDTIALEYNVSVNRAEIR